MRLWEYKGDSKGTLELWETMEKELANITASVCQNLIGSMSREVKAVLKAKSGYKRC